MKDYIIQFYEVEKMIEEYKKLNMRKEELQSKKMSRQKLQCTQPYKKSLIEKRRLLEKRKELELQLDIVLNRDMTSEKWSDRFKAEAQKQLQKNEKDKEKKRISSRTYEKRKRILQADYKIKMEELKNIRTEIEEYNINPELLVAEYNDRIAQIDAEIAKSEKFRQKLREDNNLKNQKIDEEISIIQVQLKEKERLIKEIRKNNYREMQSTKIKTGKQEEGLKEQETVNDSDSEFDIKFSMQRKPEEDFDIKFSMRKKPKEDEDFDIKLSPIVQKEQEDFDVKLERNEKILKTEPMIIVPVKHKKKKISAILKKLLNKMIKRRDKKEYKSEEKEDEWTMINVNRGKEWRENIQDTTSTNDTERRRNVDTKKQHNVSIGYRRFAR